MDAMNSPKAPPSAKPITPDMTVLPGQDSITVDICVNALVELFVEMDGGQIGYGGETEDRWTYGFYGHHGLLVGDSHVRVGISPGGIKAWVVHFVVVMDRRVSEIC